MFTTHHYILGLLVALVGCMVVWDDYARREPLLSFLAVLTGLTAFLLAWRVHPKTAATLSLAAAVAVVLLPLSPT